MPHKHSASMSLQRKCVAFSHVAISNSSCACFSERSDLCVRAQCCSIVARVCIVHHHVRTVRSCECRTYAGVCINTTASMCTTNRDRLAAAIQFHHGCEA